MKKEKEREKEEKKERERKEAEQAQEERKGRGRRNTNKGEAGEENPSHPPTARDEGAEEDFPPLTSTTPKRGKTLQQSTLPRTTRGRNTKR